MDRISIKPRKGWQETVESQGLSFHTIEGKPYWHESAFYRLSAREVDELDDAANEIQARCLDAVEEIVGKGLWERLAIPKAAIPVIERSWKRKDFSLYGRFDFSWNALRGEPPKLLEYNADTPTSVLEASAIQWFWLKDNFKDGDQFNSIHERLVDAWRKFAQGRSCAVHFASLKEMPEDEQTVLYLRDTCHQAGLSQSQAFIEDIGWNSETKRFVDLQNNPIEALFKLYPWEWMWTDEFAKHLPSESCLMIEPAWKMLLSNKGLLPILWKLFPKHPNLLPAYFKDEMPKGMDDYVLKPLLSREGANVSIVASGKTLLENGGDYGKEGFIVQKRAKIPEFDGYHPVFGAWIVDGQSAGLGIREDRSLITGNDSLFTPHAML